MTTFCKDIGFFRIANYLSHANEMLLLGQYVNKFQQLLIANESLFHESMDTYAIALIQSTSHWSIQAAITHYMQAKPQLMVNYLDAFLQSIKRGNTYVIPMVSCII